MIRNIKTTISNLFQKYYFILLLGILVLACFNIFANLNSYPITDWDEARHGVNAYEMLHNKNYIVNTYNYKTDYYNLKPPLSYWLIMLGYKLVGFSPLGLRLYSAVSALLTIMLVALFVKKKHGKFACIISTAVLATTSQYLLSHCARTGDADSVYILLFTIAMIAMTKIEKNINWIYLSGFSFSLAFLAKSWHAFTIVAIGGLYLLFSKYIFKLKLKQWLLFTTSSILPIGLWAIFRYAKDGTKFFTEMIKYDLLARSATPLEGHAGTALYYFDVIENYYSYWLIILFGVFIAFLTISNKNNEKKISGYTLTMLLWILVPFIAFSIAKTKLAWYILPIYPALAICIGAFSKKIITAFKKSNIVQFVLLLSLLLSLGLNERIIFLEVRSTHVDGKPSPIKQLSDLPEYKGLDAYTSYSAQNAIKNIKSIPEYNGVNAYTSCGTYSGSEFWDQSEFLAAELYGNLKPVNGGVKAFINDKNKSILIIPKNDNSDKIIKDNNLKIILKTDSNLILAK